MEFDLASKRLQREQQRSKQTTMKKKALSMSTPHHNTKEMQLQQKQQRQQLEEQRQKERQQKLYETQLLKAYMHKYDSQLHIQSLESSQSPPPFQPSVPVVSSSSSSKQQQQQQLKHLQLIPISIHGDGDKITLPPSILERLLQIQEQQSNGSDNLSNHFTTPQQQQQQQPWTFRIGIRNPKSLTHPMSDELLTHVRENFRKDIDDSMEDEDDDDVDDDDDDHAMEIDGSNHNTTRNRHWRKKQFLNDMSYYMNELQQHQYISYTHGTVIEFTQDEGYIGIPKTIANSLLLQPSFSTKINIETTRTVDPAAAAKHIPEEHTNSDDTVIDPDEADEEKTPGHVAYDAFDIPALPIEMVLLQLPKGTGMTLRPIMNSKNNSTTKSFYDLQQDQVKYALEQSIQRTRATITLHDTITTWYRGNEYQFLVTKLVTTASSNPNGMNLYNAVSCINTDIEIEFEPMNVGDDAENMDNHSSDVATTTTMNSDVHTTRTTGRRLVDEPSATTQQSQGTFSRPSHSSSTVVADDTIPLPPEPPMEEKTNIITIQFRFSTNTGSTIQRRFNMTTTTIRDLFQFVRQSSGRRTLQQLVRRYPRRVFTSNDNDMTLQEASFQPGNELLIVEEV